MKRFGHLLCLSMFFSSAPAASADEQELYDIIAPSVVRITVTGTTPQGMIEEKSATGVIISQDGYALTSMHTFYAANDVTAPYVGEIKAMASVPMVGGPFANVPFEIVDADIAQANPRDKTLLIKLRTYPGFKYRPARVCRSSPQRGSALWGAGFLNDGDLAVRPGTFDSDNSRGGMWQTGLALDRGFSGGPVLIADGSVVALIEEGIGTGTAGSRAVPVYNAPVGRGGVDMASCVGRPVAADPTSISYAWQVNYLTKQIDQLYAPLNLRLQLGEAEYLYFTEKFYAGFGRRSAQQYTETVDANGVKIVKPVPMTDAEWAYWMQQVRTKFKPHNDTIVKLISDNANLLDGGILTDCYKQLLLHITAFDDSLKMADADAALRTWAPNHSWPACLVPEVAAKLKELQLKQSELSMRLSTLNAR